ncbi:sugar transferase [Paraflavisolibacter sp. H34]|uniref:sugar transferase n=1 Tax=Huijunlia imazamoxiresistens TaxID=3127457 RepID=UPI003015B455
MYYHNADNLPLTNEKFRMTLKSFSRNNRMYLGSKRVFDIVVSLLVILFLLSWLIPVLALLIRLDSKGPVFFIQKRVGAGGKLFNCLKLRSMVTNAHANTKQAQKNDPRITALGSFLRKACLDELPQFFNVFMGDMSIVGPRPHMIQDCNDFTQLVPQYNSRHLVKPGITGIAQIKGCRGETKSIYDVMHRYQWDMFYIRNINFFLDLKIIYKTFLQTVSDTMKQEEEKKAITTKTTVVTKEKTRSDFQDHLVEVLVPDFKASAYLRK